MPVARLEVSRPASAHGHDDLFQGAVAGPLADAVDRAFDLAGAAWHGGQAVGDGHAQVVVAVDAQHGLVDAADVLLQVSEWPRAYWLGHGVADRVGDVDGGGAGVDGAFDDLGQEVEFGARRRPRARIRRRRNSSSAPCDAVDGPADDFVLGHHELELAMDGAGGQEDVDAAAFSIADGFGRRDRCRRGCSGPGRR